MVGSELFSEVPAVPGLVPINGIFGTLELRAARLYPRGTGCSVDGECVLETYVQVSAVPTTRVSLTLTVSQPNRNAFSVAMDTSLIKVGRSSVHLFSEMATTLPAGVIAKVRAQIPARALTAGAVTATMFLNGQPFRCESLVVPAGSPFSCSDNKVQVQFSAE